MHREATVVTERLCFHKRLSFCPQGGPGRHPRADIPPSPPQETATAADGTHPTGMHSFSVI